MGEQMEDIGATSDTQRQRPSAIIAVLRIFGMLCCLVVAAAGLDIARYGVVWLWETPAKVLPAEWPEEFFGAGLLTLIGLIMAIFPLKWFVQGIKAFRSGGSTRPGPEETPPPSDG